ncbi:hypothetical protein RB653_007122 [Dictyostelium firmibasis]|uniref:Aminoglycoside phosphotransferase domain-containing protein n=1 Tax=Dictyostelium firmibasis TaxID=79012 RepID=A0AAN7YNR3_9MYCE
MNDYKELLKDIPYYNLWKNITLINKGFSEDLKFKVELNEEDVVEPKQQLNQTKPIYQLLRISESKLFKDKTIEFERIKLFNSVLNDEFGEKLNVTMSKPIDIGLCNKENNVWILLTWIEGQDFNDSIFNESIEIQYQLGLNAGKILKRFHSLSLPLSTSIIINGDRLERRLGVIEKFEKDINGKFRFENDQCIIDYCKLNLEKVVKINENLQNFKLVLKHNDFHFGNMILIKDNHNNDNNDNNCKLGIIDFNRSQFGYGWHEFHKIQFFNVELSIPFCVGQIDGYFNNQLPPLDFWYSFTTFVAASCLGGIVWAESINDSQIESMKNRVKIILNHFDNFNLLIPKWYTNFKNNNNDNDNNNDNNNNNNK